MVGRRRTRSEASEERGGCEAGPAWGELHAKRKHRSSAGLPSERRHLRPRADLNRDRWIQSPEC